MLTPEEMNAIFDRILAGQATEADIYALRLELQQGKYRIEAEQLNANEIHIGDRIYQGADAETIKAVLQSVLSEQQKILEQQKAKRPRIERDFLGMMKAEVVDSLKQSLHHAVLMNLGKEEQPEQVERLWDAKIKVADQPNVLLPNDTKTIEVFEREDIAGRLFILGNPGSGKTTTLLELAKALIERAEMERDFPMPVLFNLSSWKDDKQPLHEWMVQELKLRVRSDITRKWLDQHKLLPLLDGLDEMASDRQEICVKAINQQLLTGEKSLPYLVVCSRNEEYDNYETKLLLNGAISIQALTIDKIQNYLNSIDQPELCHTLDLDSELLNLVRTPLFLSIAALSFQELSQERWQTLTSTKARIEYLLDAYVQQMMERKLKRSTLKHLYGKWQPPSNRKTRFWLVLLSAQMQHLSRTEFLIEKMPPLFSEAFRFKIDLLILLLSICAFVISFYFNRNLFFGASLGVIAIFILKGIANDLTKGDIKIVETIGWSWKEARNSFSEIFIPIQTMAVIIGIIYEAKYAGIIGSFFGVLTFHLICRSERLRYFEKTFLRITFALLTIFLTISIHNSLWETLFMILIFSGIGILASLIGAFFMGLQREELQIKRSPNQGIWKSARNAILILLISTLIGAFIGITLGIIFSGSLSLLIHNVITVRKTPDMTLLSVLLLRSGLFLGLFLGLIFGLVFGGGACIKHSALRLYAHSRGWIPWNYAQFLNYCTERSLLQRVGGRYRFIHRLLQEHFAAMPFDGIEGDHQRSTP